MQYDSPFTDGAGRTRPAPFVTEPYAGYEKLRFEDHDNGEWAHMLTPGATGWGLLVSYIDVKWCHHPNTTHAGYHHIEQRYLANVSSPPGFDYHIQIPKLVPTVVQWTSVTSGPHARICPDIVADFSTDLCFSPVGIRGGAAWVDEGMKMPWVNLAYAEHAGKAFAAQNEEGFTEPSYFTDGFGEIAGLVPVHQVLPISEDAADAFCRMRDFRVREWMTWKSAICYRCLDGMADNYHHPTKECYFDIEMMGDEACACGARATLEQVTAAFHDPGSPGLDGWSYVPHQEGAHELWAYAQDRYLRGFDVIDDWQSDAMTIDSSTGQGKEPEPWYTYFWQHFSPFSGSGSLAALDRRLRVDLSSSQTQLAS